MSSVVVAFGRFQPPTIAHGMMFHLIKNLAASENADHVIFVSKTHDRKNNPLTIDVKMKFLRIMFPTINFVECDDTVRTPIEAVKSLDQKYENLTFVAGGDRIKTLGAVVEKQNGIDYNFKSIELLSVGDRDPDSDGIEGISATQLRNAAKSQDFETFRQGIPVILKDDDARTLMEMISTSIIS